MLQSHFLTASLSTKSAEKIFARCVSIEKEITDICEIEFKLRIIFLADDSHTGWASECVLYVKVGHRDLNIWFLHNLHFSLFIFSVPSSPNEMSPREFNGIKHLKKTSRFCVIFFLYSTVNSFTDSFENISLGLMT